LCGVRYLDWEGWEWKKIDGNGRIEEIDRRI
jgi:hypothetical protein